MTMTNLLVGKEVLDIFIIGIRYDEEDIVEVIPKYESVFIVTELGVTKCTRNENFRVDIELISDEALLIMFQDEAYELNMISIDHLWGLREIRKVHITGIDEYYVNDQSGVEHILAIGIAFTNGRYLFLNPLSFEGLRFEDKEGMKNFIEEYPDTKNNALISVPKEAVKMRHKYR